MPESPRYLCMIGNSNAAKDILRKFRELGDEVEHDIYIWCNKKLENYSFRNILRSTSNLRRLLPCLGLIILEQLTGIWTSFFYLSWIFRISGEFMLFFLFLTKFSLTHIHKIFNFMKLNLLKNLILLQFNLVIKNFRMKIYQLYPFTLLSYLPMIMKNNAILNVIDF